MTKETYDLMISLGFKFLNYSPDSEETNPSFFKVEYRLPSSILKYVPESNGVINFCTSTTSFNSFLEVLLELVFLEGLELGEKKCKSGITIKIKRTFKWIDYKRP